MSITDDISYIKNHLILLGISIVLIFGSVYGVESIIAKHDAEKSTELAVIADQLNASNKQFQASVQTELNQLAGANAQLQASNLALAQALATRRTVEVKLPAVNASLTAQQAAEKIGELTKGVSTSNGSSVVLDTPTAQTAVTDLEMLLLLQQDKVDLTAALADETDVAVNTTKALDLEKQAHTSDNTSSAAALKAKDTETTTIKAQARKSKIKWFAADYVAGWVSAHFIGL